MQINYLILAHVNPKQVKKMVLTLNAPWVNFYIHIDKNIEISSFQDPLKTFKNVHFLNESEREEGTWGHIDIVKAIITILKKLTNGKSYTVILTGQDYPLRNNNDIFNFFQKNYGTQYISIFSLPASCWKNGGMERITKYKFNLSSKRGDFILIPSIFEKEFFKSLTFSNLKSLLLKMDLSFIKQIFKKRRFPDDIDPYGGGVYWAFTSEIIQKILAYIDKHPEYLSFHTHTLCPDEIFFHSILMKLREELSFEIKPSLTYVDWSRLNQSLPVTFREDDLEILIEKSNDHLFARKFNQTLDSNILEKIDTVLLT